jgi:hypothetical protein
LTEYTYPNSDFREEEEKNRIKIFLFNGNENELRKINE